MSLTHAEIEELLGAYALDAVDDDEANAVEVHLRQCPRCRDEVAAHRQTAALMAHGGTDAPAGVWDRIAGSLTEVLPGVARTLPWAQPPQRRRRMPIVPMLAAGLAAAAAIVVVLGVTIAHQDRRLDRLSLAQSATAALVNPAAHTAHMVSADGSVSVDAVVLPDGRGYVVRDSLPNLPGDRTYQLWSLETGGPVSLGVLGSSPDVVAFHADRLPTEMAITAEHGRRGAPKPHLPAVVSGAVRA